MKKMVVSSFYNTLINEEDAIPTSTMLEIERIRKKGIVFSVCTNRTVQEVLDYNKDFPFLDYVIALNGSLVFDVEKNKYLTKRKISLANINKIEKIFEGRKKKIYTENKVYDKISSVGDQEIYKIEIENPTKEDLESCKKLSVNVSQMMFGEKNYLEITSNKCSTFTAVDHISLKLGIRLNEIVVICCNETEVPLVKNIPSHIIMKNSCEAIKKLSKKVTNSNREKGVERVLKKC